MNGPCLSLAIIVVFLVIVLLLPRRNGALRVDFRFGSAAGKEVIMAVLNLTADQVDALTDKKVPFSIAVKDDKGRPASIDPTESSWAVTDDGAGAVLTVDASATSGELTLPTEADGSAKLTTGQITGLIDVKLAAGETKQITALGQYAVTTEGTTVELTFGVPH